MALQPIDLQTMYSQMANVAQRVASEGQGAALSQSIQTQGIVNQNLQQSQSVQKTAANETQTGKIKADANGRLFRFCPYIDKPSFMVGLFDPL